MCSSCTITYLIRGRCNLRLGLGHNVLGSSSIKILHLVDLLGQDLHRGVLVDGDGAGGDEELLDGAILLVDRDDSGLENGQGRNVVGKDTKSSRERGNINLKE